MIISGEYLLRIISQVKSRTLKGIKDDIIAGIIVALVSIPISMGYAQIAGLPAVYGLYGSLLPILVYGLLTTSPQFVVGIDAMPAAMVGGLLTTLSITPESDTAKIIVPMMAALVAVWFIIFCFIKAGRIVKYISTPVMGGFISGVGITIILMQIPKLFGAAAGTGNVSALLINIVTQLGYFNGLSAVLGLGTVAIILICKKYVPKVPMTVIMMGVGALLQVVFGLDKYGVKLLPEVEKGLGAISLPALYIPKGNVITILIESLSIAAVIMAQTLLATGNYASKYSDEIDNNKELLAYAGMNMAGSLVGCPPINGSVSRSAIADSFKARSQLMSVSAAISMALVLLFGTGLLKYLPVPVLTGIVLTALIGIVDIKMCSRLWKTCRNEWVIFVVSLIGVLVLGTVGGVIFGCILSFGEVAMRSVVPPTTFVGRIPGHGNFHSLERNSHARPIKGTIIYRFNGNLFFANIDKFERDIENAIKSDTRQIVVDARGIGTIDITAVDRLLGFENKLTKRGIKFYLTEHESSLNDQIRTLGGSRLIDDGVTRRTITLALRDAGLEKPYELEGEETDTELSYMEDEEKLAEFEWAFGDEAEERLRKLANQTADEMARQIKSHDSEHIYVLENHGATTGWGMLGLFDEHEFWDFLEARLEDMQDDGVLAEEDVKWLEARIEKRRELGEKRLEELNPRALKILSKHREKILKIMSTKDPEGYEHIKKIVEHIREERDGHGNEH